MNTLAGILLIYGLLVGIAIGLLIAPVVNEWRDRWWAKRHAPPLKGPVHYHARRQPIAPEPTSPLDLGAFPSHRPGETVSSAFLIALGDEPDARAAVARKTRFA